MNERLLRVARDPVRGAFLARAVEAIADVAETADVATLAHALGAGSAQAVLYQSLVDPAFLVTAVAGDPLAGAKARSLQQRQALLEAEGGVWSASGVARHLGISEQAVSKRRLTGALLGLPVRGRQIVYPVWQFDGERVLPGLREVLAAFRPPDPWLVAGWLLGPNTYLDGRRPLDVLREGSVGEIQRAAAAYGQHGAA